MHSGPQSACCAICAACPQQSRGPHHVACFTRLMAIASFADPDIEQLPLDLLTKFTHRIDAVTSPTTQSPHARSTPKVGLRLRIYICSCVVLYFRVSIDFDRHRSGVRSKPCSHDADAARPCCAAPGISTTRCRAKVSGARWSWKNSWRRISPARVDYSSHSYIHTYIHSYIHTCIYIYMHVFVYLFVFVFVLTVN